MYMYMYISTILRSRCTEIDSEFHKLFLSQPQSSGSIPSPLAPRPRQRVVLQRQVTPSLEQDEINKMAAEEVQGDLSTEVFSTYAARHAVFASARPHPADIVEAASLAVSLAHSPCWICFL